MKAEMSDPSRIWTPIDYDKDGKHEDCLRLPISGDLSAYGWVSIPLVMIKNGSGPTALLIAGSHGDEYEGQIALSDLARALEVEDVQGRIIILPSLNFPAVKAGRRVSPLDEGNLNRLYPGRAHGSETEMIAHYVTTVLLPMADIVVDLHSGGRSLEYVKCALIRPGRNEPESKRLLELLHVFGAPIGYLTDGKGGGGNTTLPAIAETLDVPVITTELGGGATFTFSGHDIAADGVKRLLKHMGIVPNASPPTPPPTRLMEVPGRDYFLYASKTGLFVPAAEVGEEVHEGEHAGLLHNIDHPTHEPEPYSFPKSGMIACRRFPTLTQRGDCLYALMRDVDMPEISR
jgi:predicted deacylase